jgi:hypothetical protein
MIRSDLIGHGQATKSRPDLNGEVVVDDVVLVDDTLLNLGLVTFSEFELYGRDKLLLLDVGERVVEPVIAMPTWSARLCARGKSSTALTRWPDGSAP